MPLVHMVHFGTFVHEERIWILTAGAVAIWFVINRVKGGPGETSGKCTVIPRSDDVYGDIGLTGPCPETHCRISTGAGLIKVRGSSCWTDRTCLWYHFETQPMLGIDFYVTVDLDWLDKGEDMGWIVSLTNAFLRNRLTDSRMWRFLCFLEHKIQPCTHFEHILSATKSLWIWWTTMNNGSSHGNDCFVLSGTHHPCPSCGTSCLVPGLNP